MKVWRARLSLVSAAMALLPVCFASAQLLYPPAPPVNPVVPPPPRPLPNLVPTQFQFPQPAMSPLDPTLAPMPVPKSILMPPPTVMTPPNYGPLTALTFDAEQKEATPSGTEQHVNFTFWFTNTSPKDVQINAVRTSCGCTVARLPATPWLVPPGTNGPIEVAVDIRGKAGVISKSVTVETTAGAKSLIVKMNLPLPGTQPGFPVAGGPGGLPPDHPPMADADRLANMQKSLADRQVVFKDAACAKCHADPAKDVADGATIYQGICATCHDSRLRAAMVTDLRALKHETDFDYWKHWITHGKPGSMMPSFAQSAGEGGPLSDAQVQALAKYCFQTFQVAKPVLPPPVLIKPTNATVSVLQVPPKAN